jgi:flavodoxin
MKHESIIVVYDSCQAIAEEIAGMLGAETVSVQSMNNRYVENSQSFVLAVEYQEDGQLTPHWQYAFQTFCSANLSGKTFAVFVALGKNHDYGISKKLCSGLKQSKAHIVGEQPNATSPIWNLDKWVCSISPNL